MIAGVVASFALKLMEWLAIDAKPARWLAWVLIILAAIAVLGAGKCTYDANIIKDHEATTSAKLERSGRQADTSAAQRAEARRRAEELARKEFNNATAGIPDNGLSYRQRIDLCNELHEAGAPLIPECRDVRAGAQARPGYRHPPAEQRGGKSAASAEQGRVGAAGLGQGQ